MCCCCCCFVVVLVWLLLVVCCCFLFVCGCFFCCLVGYCRCRCSRRLFLMFSLLLLIIISWLLVFRRGGVRRPLPRCHYQAITKHPHAVAQPSPSPSLQLPHNFRAPQAITKPSAPPQRHYQAIGDEQFCYNEIRTHRINLENDTTLYYTTPHYTTLYYTTLHYTTLRYNYTTLHYSTLHYNTSHYITPHCIALHYITLRYIALPYLT